MLRKFNHNDEDQLKRIHQAVDKFIKQLGNAFTCSTDNKERMAGITNAVLDLSSLLGTISDNSPCLMLKLHRFKECKFHDVLWNCNDTYKSDLPKAELNKDYFLKKEDVLPYIDCYKFDNLELTYYDHTKRDPSALYTVEEVSLIYDPVSIELFGIESTLCQVRTWSSK